MPMTMEDFKRIGDQACVSVAAGHDCMWDGVLLEQSLWPALVEEMQRRYRRSTGDSSAVLTLSRITEAGKAALEGGA